jgi:hypothetical protein
VNNFPAINVQMRALSSSTKKRKSDEGRPITEAHLNFYWLDHNGRPHHAPDAKIIDYFQYPEARLSGFLNNCQWAPEAVRRKKQAEFGRRILGLGANRSGEVFGLLISERDDPLASDFPDLPPSGISGVLSILSISGNTNATPREQLADELRKIVAAGWHKSVRNKKGAIIPFHGKQGAGYTLEALLGVESNALKEPDAYGHEIKSFRGSKISLMTPTADLGEEGSLKFRDFMKRYGKEGKKGDGSLWYTGVYRAGKPNKGTGYILSVVGYDSASKKFSGDPEEIRIEIRDPASNTLISGWSLEKLVSSWNTKHAFAAYVPATSRSAPTGEGEEYKFIDPWYMCEGTDVWRLIRAIASGLVYYDPGHQINPSGKPWARPQWRIATNHLEKALKQLYVRVTLVS